MNKKIFLIILIIVLIASLVILGITETGIIFQIFRAIFFIDLLIILIIAIKKFMHNIKFFNKYREILMGFGIAILVITFIILLIYNVNTKIEKQQSEKAVQNFQSDKGGILLNEK